jgi:2'-hydroxyisoflavone reductase
MKLLVLGGTIFVGHAVAVEATRRGHEVVCAARGESGSVPDGATLVKVDRNAEDGLTPLANQSFDAVVDVSPLSFPWVSRALDTLSAQHWTFVSTVNVYADVKTRDQTPATGQLVPPLKQHSTRDEMMAAGEDGVLLYGGIKVASENAVREAMGDSAFIVRPGLITGSWDRSDRFGYWPGRFARGGRVLVPDLPGQEMQLIDVKDFARWIVDAGEKGLGGTYDAIGPHRPTNTMIEEIATVVGFDGEIVKATEAQLTEAGVNPWSGPKSLPLWAPDEHDGFKTHDPTPSLEAGMPVRPFADAVADALERERELGLDRPRKAGLSLDEEKEVLAKL